MQGEPTSGAPQSTLALIRLLADEIRWDLIRELRHSDRQVGELAQRSHLPQSLISYHLGLLRQAGIVQTHRSDADARVIYYWLDLSALQDAYRRVGNELQLPHAITSSILPDATVLFLCNQNSARSQIAEGWLRTLSQGRVVARSAGVQPASLHGLATQVMAEVGIDIGFQYAKGMEAVRTLNPHMIVTVCDLARVEHAPRLTAPIQMHWSVVDPTRGRATGDERLRHFREVRDQLRVRVEGLLTALPELIATTPEHRR